MLKDGKGGETMAIYRYIRSSGVRSLVRHFDKRCGVDFLNTLNIHVEEVVSRCCKQFNGHKKTLDSTVVNFIIGKIKT